jgi:hypothetical protein
VLLCALATHQWSRTALFSLAPLSGLPQWRTDE